MKAKFIIPIGLAVVLVLFLNFGLKTQKPPVPQDTQMVNHDDHAIAALNLDSFLTELKVKLPPEVQTEISLVEGSLQRTDLTGRKITDYQRLGELWQERGYKAIAAYYYGKSGQLEKSEKKLKYAGQMMTDELQKEQDEPMLRNWMVQEGIEMYKALVELNPTNDTAKLALSALYMNTNEPMAGIAQLMSIVRKDSLNLPANIMLGKLSIQSGQFDKAIERGQKVLKVKPDNIDARLFMGEAYKQTGNKEKAIELFTEAKRLMNNPDFSKDIDEYIATFK